MKWKRFYNVSSSLYKYPDDTHCAQSLLSVPIDWLKDLRIVPALYHSTSR